MTGRASSAANIELLIFELADVPHGLRLDVVREVVRAVFVTPLPEAPPVVEGVIDVRGELVPVYDLRLRLGLPLRALHPDERIVIAWTGERLAAFRCDDADEVVTVATEDIRAAEDVVRGGRRIAGLAQLADGIVLVHDLAEFLDEAERLALDEALAALTERAAE